MSPTIRPVLYLFFAYSVITLCLAIDPQYQVPGIYKNLTVGKPSKACSDSTFDVGGSDVILAEDCGK